MFIFTPIYLGEMIQFDAYHIYSDGLVENHQLVEFFMVFVKDDFPSIFLEVDRGCEIKKNLHRSGRSSPNPMTDPWD